MLKFEFSVRKYRNCLPLNMKGVRFSDQKFRVIQCDASAGSHDVGARNAIEIFWSRPSFGEIANMQLVTILAARNAIEIFWSRTSFGDLDGASAASHEVSARNVIENLLIERGSYSRVELLKEIWYIKMAEKIVKKCWPSRCRSTDLPPGSLRSLDASEFEFQFIER